MNNEVLFWGGGTDGGGGQAVGEPGGEGFGISGDGVDLDFPVLDCLMVFRSAEPDLVESREIGRYQYIKVKSRVGQAN